MVGWWLRPRRATRARLLAWAAVWAAPAGLVRAAPAGLLPGRYGGQTADGDPVWVEVATSGALRATVAGVEHTFAPEAVRLRVSAEGPCLEGLAPPGPVPTPGAPTVPTQAVCLQPVAGPLRAATDAARPAAWIGRWRHQATGGAVTLHLGADGSFALETTSARTPTGHAQTQAPATSQSRWHAEGSALVITLPGASHPVRYQVRLDAGAPGPSLGLSGGDLPFEAIFTADTPASGPAVPPHADP